MKKEEIIKRFPNIYKRCLEEGYAMEKDPVPITPAQHYFMGGIKVDMKSSLVISSFKALMIYSSILIFMLTPFIIKISILSFNFF